MKKHRRHIIIKQFLKKSVACLLAALVLTSSAGVPLYKQTCLMMDAEKLTFFQAPDCCPTKKTTATKCHHKKQKHSKSLHIKPTKCCDLSVDFIKVELQSGSTNKVDIKWNNVAILLPYTLDYLQSTPSFFTPAKYFYTDVSPPLSGKHRIIQKQSFLL